jgi:nucleoside-diphosphate-sugar epimerase
MKILITGSEGLIGSNLRVALMGLGQDVFGIDIKHPLDHVDYGDILDTGRLFSQINQVDGIVHLAAISRVVAGERNPQLCWKTNVEGTRNIVHAALSSEKKPWVIYASSREVYGEQKELPVQETAPLHPVNIYGESKLKGEKIILKAQQKGLKSAIVRLSNVYGTTHDHFDRVVPAFCRAAVDGTPIQVEGSGNLFDFTHVEDVVQGITSLIRLLTNHEQSPPPIHLASGIGTTLGRLAEVARNSSLLPVRIIERPSRTFDVCQFYGDPKRAKELLNWQASITIEEGMRRLINQFRIHHISSEELIYENFESHSRLSAPV